MGRHWLLKVFAISYSSLIAITRNQMMENACWKLLELKGDIKNVANAESPRLLKHTESQQ